MKNWKAGLSGILAATAGVFGKFGLQNSEDLWYFKVASIGFMLVVNSLMINFLVKSYRDIGAAKTTVVNLAFNYLFSAILAFLIYNEEISSGWAAGALFMFVGVSIINSDS
jgi:drug/metabolite transporter (DMT)-like permease